MKIGIAAPIETSSLSEYLSENVEKLPKGLGGTYVVQLIKGLLHGNYRVSVYSLDSDVISPIILRGNSLTIYYGIFRRKHRMRDFMKIERDAICNFIKMDNPTIVHAHWTYEFALGALASKKPTLITVRDWAPAISYIIPDAYRLGRLLMSFTTLIKGTHFTANSPYIQRLIKKYFRKDVPVIPNSLSDELFYKDGRKLKVNRPIIVSINNGFGKLKNVKALIKAYRLVRKDIPNSRLVLIGIGFEKNGEVEEWAKRNYLSGGIDFLGWIPHKKVLEILESSDLLIHPSLEESFGMTLLEAMAKKTPVIGGKNSGAVPWMLNYGKAGVLTDVRSPKFIANEAIKLLTNKIFWDEYSLAGYNYAWENFRTSKNVEKTIREYKKVLYDIKL